VIDFVALEKALNEARLYHVAYARVKDGRWVLHIGHFTVRETGIYHCGEPLEQSDVDALDIIRNHIEGGTN
jgi:hypothetical protein